MGGVLGECGRSQNRSSRVARAGIEPATFRFSGERYYRLSYLAVPVPAHRFERSGGEDHSDRRCSRDPDGTRTRDLRRDRAAR